MTSRTQARQRILGEAVLAQFAVVATVDDVSPAWKQGYGHTKVPGVVWQMHSLTQPEIKMAAQMARDKHPNATISVENQSGKIIKVYKPGQKIVESNVMEADDSKDLISCPYCHRKVNKNAGWCKHCKQDIVEAAPFRSTKFTEAQLYSLWQWANTYRNSLKREYALRCYEYIRDKGPAWVTKDRGLSTVKIPAGLSANDAHIVRLDAQEAGDIALSEETSSTPKPPSEVDRLKTQQERDMIALKTRQNQAIMAAKLRDLAAKTHDQQVKLNAPKGHA